MAKLARTFYNQYLKEFDMKSRDFNNYFLCYLAALIVVFPLSKFLFLIILIFALSLITFPFRTKNLLGIMFGYLILEPLVITIITFIVLTFLVVHFNLDSLIFIYLFSPLVILHIITVIHILIDRHTEPTLNKVKLALEYNNSIFLTLTSLFTIFLLSTNDLSYLNVFTNNGKMLEDGYTNKDFINFVFSLLTFPFLIANSITKAIVEHKLSKIQK